MSKAKVWRGSGRVLEVATGWQKHIGELSVREAAEALGVSESTVSRARRSGVAPRALSDPDRAAALQRAWSAYRHTNRFRQVRGARDQKIQQIRDARVIEANGVQGTNLDSARAIRHRHLGGANRREGRLTPLDAERLAFAYAQGAEPALARAVAAHFLAAYWGQPHGTAWVMEQVEVTIGDFVTVLSNSG